mgnify:CR=1 FL=1
MKKEERLDRKVYRLFRASGNPKWLHHMGPKKFESWILCLGMIVKQVYQLSYRRAVKFLDEHYSFKLHWTTLQKAMRRLPKSIWQSLLATTITVDVVSVAALDGTGFSRSGPSQYYLKRIDRDDTSKKPVQCIAMIDVNKRKFLSADFFAKPHGEPPKTKHVYKQCPVDVDILLMDKGFDAEYLHKFLNTHGTFSVAPVRKGCRRGKHRKFLRDNFDWCLYWQRNIVECLFSALKRLFGNTVKCQHIKTINAELFCRLIAYNIGSRQCKTFYRAKRYTIKKVKINWISKPV